MERYTIALSSVTRGVEIVGFALEYESEHDLFAGCYIRQAINGKNVEFSDNILTLSCDGKQYHFTGTREPMTEIYRLIRQDKRALETLQAPAQPNIMIVKLRGAPYDKVECIGGSIAERNVQLVRRSVPSTERQRKSLSSSGW